MTIWSGARARAPPMTTIDLPAMNVVCEIKQQKGFKVQILIANVGAVSPVRDMA